MKIAGLSVLMLLVTGMAYAQEINFSRVQDMTVWYNQSLKTDKQNTVKLNYRNVSYQGLMAYNSVAAMIDIPLIKKVNREEPDKGYFSLSGAVASDKSNQGIFSNTVGLLGLSYALPLGDEETYAAVGFQGSYYQSRLNTVNMDGAFPDQFDQYGPITGAQSKDNIAGNWAYYYFNLNTGISIFSNGENNKWYIGASVMHVNQPYTDQKKLSNSKLSPQWSFQGGYTYITPDKNEASFHATLNWQAQAYKHFFNVNYIKSLPGIQGGVGCGLSYRYNDAVIPDIEIRYSNVTIAALYDINVSDIHASGYQRNGIELALKLDF
ncbi:type IX secretion system membrane protein PorP/SprF [Deminuibacter soli]|uniref:Type IX secretion system membrane protein PorP/SprF n=1 Tax=Deminuibacter soli TaxID=2291815 RepID=A0A3E1NHR1_9BACT|nr:type IX secretion system membrane protein PorP/SprF [Deminuibacter soli]RFM27384.1 type IX secretion system membrane protein PorP/SprF [Deminuibacter soli]